MKTLLHLVIGFGMCLLACHQAIAQEYTLTIQPSENSTIAVDPDLQSYPAGTEVTLTATPNEGYQFAGWTAETVTGEPQVATAYDNLEHTTGDYLTPSGKDRKFAQQFLMNGASAMQQVELKLFRIGTVTGSMAVELWNDDGNNDPGEKIADLGTIDDVSTMPTTDTTYTFTKLVEDLDPDGKYWVVTQFEGLTSTLGGLQNNVAWRWSFSAEGSMGADHAHVLRAQDNGVWSRMTDEFGDPTLMFRMRVQTISAGATEQLELPHENPLTFTINADTNVTPEFAAIPSVIIHYDTLDHVHASFNRPHRSTKLTLTYPDIAGARDSQPFVAGGNNVTSVTLGLGRQGMPGGRIQFEIWSATPSGSPSQIVGVLGEIDFNSLTNYPSWPNAPNFLNEVTITGLVSGLNPGELYSLVFYYPMNDYSGASFEYGYGAVDGPDEYDVVDMRLQDPGNPWADVSSLYGTSINYYLRARISGAATLSSHTLTITPSDGGTVTADPDLETYPADTEVTLTAAQNEGYEFTKWLIGESESTDNPLTFAIEADTTITPEFAEIPATFTLTITSSDGGAVVASPDMETYPAGTVVTLTATPNEGYTLASWKGDTNEEGNPSAITLTIERDTAVTAVFAASKALDSDSDGLTDAEEALLGTDPNKADSDGDSFTDHYEVKAGKDPLNGEDQPALPSIATVTMDYNVKTVALTWSSLADAQYELQSSADLQSWQSLGLWAGGAEWTTATVPVGEPQRYYRLAPNGHLNAEACVAKVGMIQNFDRNHSGLLQDLTRFFPVDAFEVVLLENNTNDHGVDAVVDEMEAVVNDMKSRGITRIYMSTFSTEAAPFIEGNAGSLGGVHSDQRHPEVIFAADRQGTASVDNAQNWYRPGIDFKTLNILGPETLLPEISGQNPQPQFILATDFSGAVDGQNTAFLKRAAAVGYEVVEIDAQWNAETIRFDNVAALSAAIAAAPAGSKVGMSFSAESLDGQPSLTRWTDMTKQGLADPHLFDPNNSNVTYLSMNWVPFHGDFEAPGSIPVDVQYGVVAVPELTADPAGVNSLLVNLGFPKEGLAAIDYDSTHYDNGGHVAAAVFAWLATCGQRNLDARYTMDENRQHVFHYVLDEYQPAGKSIFETVDENLRVNPRWEALSPMP